MARSKQNHGSGLTGDRPPEDLVRALNIVCSDAIEGGYVNDPADPGGETKYGISKRAYPDEDIANLTPERAAEIYRPDYWDAAHCNDLPWPVNLVVFDGAVNQGVFAAKRCLQLALKVTADGVVGPVTLAAAARRDPLELAIDVLSHRALRYAGTSNFDRFGRGWMVRVIRIAMEMPR